MADIALHHQPKHGYHHLKHRFEILQSLGSGTYGKVKLALDRKTGQKVSSTDKLLASRI